MFALDTGWIRGGNQVEWWRNTGLCIEWRGDVTPMKRKGGRGEAADFCDAYDGRTEFLHKGVDMCYSVIEIEKKIRPNHKYVLEKGEKFDV